ncbi:MAG: hypothetical protein H6R07_644 [Proteobacteria bacterium]|nr:hypothetical protein [Pseudomonadota bacterium]
MIELRNLTVCYRKHPAIHHISGCFAAGSHTAIVGPNGAGKTTLLKAMVGLLPATGDIEIHGEAGYLPQLTELDRQFPLTVAELALAGNWRTAGNWARIQPQAREQAHEALERVGLEDFATRSLATLSGGQLQRARFARLIVQNAPVVLLDEPFNSVDSRTLDILLAVLDEWHGAGKTLVTVVHDLALARSRFPSALLLAREVIAWGACSEVLCSENLARAQAAIHGHDEDEWCERP